MKWKVISKEAGIATNVGIGLRDKKSSNQQQREEKRQKWRKRKNQITMSPETHPPIKQTRSENSRPTLEMAESKEKVQLKGTELKQLDIEERRGRVANCPAAFLSYFHCGFVMKYSRRWEPSIRLSKMFGPFLWLEMTNLRAVFG